MDIDTPADEPNGSGPNYSADYRLSSLQATSIGLKINYKVNENFSLSGAYEHYAMEGVGPIQHPHKHPYCQHLQPHGSNQILGTTHERSGPEQILKAQSQGVRELEFRALGTECHIKIRLKSERDALQFAADTLEWIKNFEEKYSRYLDTSLISKINAAAGQSWIETDEDAERLLNVAEEVFRKSEGILDATMLPLARVWDWKKIHQELPNKDDVQEALRLTGWDKVERREGAIF